MYITRDEFDRARIVGGRRSKKWSGWRYRVVRGTLYDPSTPFEVVRMLELARYREARVCIHYGITEAMAGPNPSHFIRLGGYLFHHEIVIGFVRQSRGRLKRPVIVYIEGTDDDPIQDENIVGIWPAEPGQRVGVLYRHPGYGPLPVER